MIIVQKHLQAVTKELTGKDTASIGELLDKISDLQTKAAAAPELLEACKELLEALKNMGGKTCYNGVDTDKAGNCVCTACKAGAAIAAAK